MKRYMRDPWERSTQLILLLSECQESGRKGLKEGISATATYVVNTGVAASLINGKISCFD